MLVVRLRGDVHPGHRRKRPHHHRPAARKLQAVIGRRLPVCPRSTRHRRPHLSIPQ